MWLARLRHGVLQIATDSGRRLVDLSVGERFALLWTFRNFKVLPRQVLTDGQQQLIAELCSRRSVENPLEIHDDLVIGTVEWSPALPKKPPASQRAPLGARARTVGTS